MNYASPFGPPSEPRRMAHERPDETLTNRDMWSVQYTLGQHDARIGALETRFTAMKDALDELRKDIAVRSEKDIERLGHMRAEMLTVVQQQAATTRSEIAALDARLESTNRTKMLLLIFCAVATGAAFGLEGLAFFAAP